MHKVILLPLFLLIFGQIAAHDDYPLPCFFDCCEPCDWCGEIDPLQLSVAYAGGREVGVDQGYGTLALQYAPYRYTGRPQFLFDLAGHMKDDGRAAANVGIGIRCPNSNYSRVYGANLFYDFRQGHYHGFHQVGVGIESLGCTFDFRANGYFPVERKSEHSSADRIRQYVLRDFEFALKGVDAEIGAHLGRMWNINFYSAVGPYYIQKSGIDHSWGGRFRALAKWNDNLQLELHVTYDKLYENRVQAELSYNFPLPFCNKTKHSNCNRNLIAQPIQRARMIFLGRTCCFKS